MAGWDNLFTRFGRRLKAAFSRARGRKAASFFELLGNDGNTANWTQDRNELVRHFRTWSYIAIRAIARQIAMDAPEFAYKRAAAAVGKSAYLPVRNKALTGVRDNQDLESIDDQHPLRRLFADPNEPDTTFDLFYEHILFYELTGISYWWARPANELQRRLGLPGELWVLPSNWVRPRWSGNAWVDYYEVYAYGSSSPTQIPADQIIAFPQKHPYAKRDGWAPMSAGSAWIDTSDAVDRLSLRSLHNSAFPSLAIQVNDEKYADPDDEELEQIMAKARARLQGEENVGGVLFNKTNCTTTVLHGVSQAEIGFMQSRPWLRDAILSLHGTPYTACNIVGGATDENYFESMRGWHAGTINPTKRQMGQIITEKICPRYDPSIVCYFKDTTPLDPAIENAEIETDYRCRAISPNEIRRLRGRDPYPEAEYDRPPATPEPAAAGSGEGAGNGKPVAGKKPAPAFSRNGTAGRKPVKN